MIKQQIRKYIAAIMPYDVSLIFIGRENFYRNDLGKEYIVVDCMTNEQVGSGTPYDGIEQEHRIAMAAEMTVSFFGQNAPTLAQRFMSFQDSEESLQHQLENDLSVLRPKNITDVGALVGSQQTKRIDVDFKAQYVYSEKRAVPLIEIADVDFLTDR